MGNSNNNSQTPTKDFLEKEASSVGLKVISYYSGKDYGPLDFCFEEHKGKNLPSKDSYTNSFSGGSYVIATPKEGSTLKLYRLHGGNSPAVGQYWMAEKREGNMSTQHDLALHPKWKNTMKFTNEIEIPNGLFVIYGKCSSQSGFGGGGYQVFIPNDYSKPFQDGNLNDTLSKQINFYERYIKKTNQLSIEMVEKYQTLENTALKAKNGNSLSSLPKNVQDLMRKDQRSLSSNQTIKEGTYEVHREELHLPNGNKIKMTLRVNIRFSHETKRTYKTGNTIVNETTRHYIKEFIWS